MSSTQSNERQYPLKRDTLASARLNLNHFWMKNLAGYLLHPKIPTNVDNFRLADLGAGTGLWACDVAAALPNASVDVVDISDAQFPPDAFRPRNTRFWTHDCFQPFPPEYLGQFDAVNIKFMLCIVNDDVADKLIENVLMLLKPGGHLQWFEPLPNTVRHRGRTDKLSTPACDKLMAMWKKPAPQSSYNWVHALPKLFESYKLQVIAEDRHENPDYYMQVVAQSMFLGQLEHFGSAPGVEEQAEQLQDEFRSGAMVDVVWTCVVGRKAL
ncbi:S-adenosyl-L-methionine-dependent methyltransferase [Cucurbitaria berberidis CBS 394.84]|uniref:S-adenosyl-L-methionine-dependent methyltransferase n=1 Tax=Cucurbitaria berberidis CBS 394.84 TaxID=1168544 RepID=A0A9P4LA46_9PLEO|nr:S-adenosyl-L-methionine-dependent methyltransferase [Cucurbitaria berberidis CBS 394.84]KAF1846859.1 S-adenosyl-L-methionine-dependent methyltransferase [Cucurbitaria berberidis CBS 394.84]